MTDPRKLEEQGEGSPMDRVMIAGEWFSCNQQQAFFLKRSQVYGDVPAVAFIEQGTGLAVIARVEDVGAWVYALPEDKKREIAEQVEREYQERQAAALTPDERAMVLVANALPFKGE